MKPVSMKPAASDNFTLLRLIFALMVVFAHSWEILGLVGPVAFGRYLGTLAVQCFFIVSGYLVTGSYLSTASPAKFALKRFLRIAPALFVAYWFSIFLWNYFDHFSGNPLPYADGPIWTLVWEVVLYILVLCLGVTGLLNPAVIGATYVSGLVLFFSMLNDRTAEQLVIPAFFMMFAGGAMIRLYEDKMNVVLCGAIALVVVLALYMPGLAGLSEQLLDSIVFLYGPKVPFATLAWYISLIAIPFIVIWLARYFVASVPLESDYSYGVYIFAWPVQQVVAWYILHLHLAIGPHGLFIISAAITGGFAALSWHVIEKRALFLSRARYRPLGVETCAPPVLVKAAELADGRQ